MYNQATLIGRLTAEPVLSYSQEGKARCKFTLAVNRQYNKEETDFIDITAWGKTAEFCASYLDKGRLILVTGPIRISSYTDKQDIRRKSFEIYAKDIKFLDKPKGKGENGDNDGEYKKSSKSNYNKNQYNNNEGWDDYGKEVSLNDIDIIDENDDIPF